MIDISLTRAQFVQLVGLLDREKTNLEFLAKSSTLPEEDEKKYRRELYDVNGLMAAVLEEDADEYEYPEPV